MSIFVLFVSMLQVCVRLLADGNRLVSLVVPSALLEFCRGVLMAVFSSIIQTLGVDWGTKHRDEDSPSVFIHVASCVSVKPQRFLLRKRVCLFHCDRSEDVDIAICDRIESVRNEGQKIDLKWLMSGAFLWKQYNFITTSSQSNLELPSHVACLVRSCFAHKANGREESHPALCRKPGHLQRPQVGWAVAWYPRII